VYADKTCNVQARKVYVNGDFVCPNGLTGEYKAEN